MSMKRLDNSSENLLWHEMFLMDTLLMMMKKITYSSYVLIDVGEGLLEIENYKSQHFHVFVFFLLVTGRLLQLLLGCAVNCDQKQLYIENIMNMEESVQQLIMQAIQELLDHQVMPFFPQYKKTRTFGTS